MRFGLVLVCLELAFGQAPATDNHEPHFHHYRVATPLAERSASAFTTTPRFDGNEARADQDLRDVAAAGPNFAGHFAIISWTCGMRCEGFAVVEVKTGRIYHPGFQMGGCGTASKDQDLLSFRLDSRLLILNGRREDYSKIDDPCGTFYYLLDDGQQQTGGRKKKSHTDREFSLRQIPNRGNTGN